MRGRFGWSRASQEMDLADDSSSAHRAKGLLARGDFAVVAEHGEDARGQPARSDIPEAGGACVGFALGTTVHAESPRPEFDGLARKANHSFGEILVPGGHANDVASAGRMEPVGRAVGDGVLAGAQGGEHADAVDLDGRDAPEARREERSEQNSKRPAQP